MEFRIFDYFGFFIDGMKKVRARFFGEFAGHDRRTWGGLEIVNTVNLLYHVAILYFVTSIM